MRIFSKMKKTDYFQSRSSQKSISFFTAIGFGVTDLLGGGYASLVNAYLMFFYTTFCNLSPLQAGSIIGMAKVVDSITSIVMGKLSDDFYEFKIGRKFGRRRFFIMIGSPLILIVYTLLWIPKMSYTYYLIIYCLVEIVVTMIMIPYETLPSEMTKDYKDRTKMSTIRMIFSSSITSVVTLVGGFYINIIGDKNPYAYTLTGITFAIVFSCACFITYKTTWERSVEIVNLKKREITSSKNIRLYLKSTFEDYFSTLKVKAFRRHLYVYLLGVTGQDLFESSFVYFMVFGFGLKSATASWLLSLGIVSIPLMPINYWLFTRFGVKNCYTFYFSFIILGIFTYFGIYWLSLSYRVLIILLIVLSIIYLFFKSGAYTIPWNVFPFIPDIDEIITGKRREGEFASVMTFIRKITSGISAVILGTILSRNGFEVGQLSQSLRATHAIVYTITFGVALLTVLALIFSLGFNLNYQTHLILVNEINRLKEGGKKVDVKPHTRKVIESLTGISYEQCWPLEKNVENLDK